MGTGVGGRGKAGGDVVGAEVEGRDGEEVGGGKGVGEGPEDDGGVPGGSGDRDVAGDEVFSREWVREKAG